MLPNEAAVLHQHLQRVVNPSEQASFFADVDIGMLVDHAVQVRRSRPGSSKDDYWIGRQLRSSSHHRPAIPCARPFSFCASAPLGSGPHLRVRKWTSALLRSWICEGLSTRFDTTLLRTTEAASRPVSRTTCLFGAVLARKRSLLRSQRYVGLFPGSCHATAA